MVSRHLRIAICMFVLLLTGCSRMPTTATANLRAAPQPTVLSDTKINTPNGAPDTCPVTRASDVPFMPPTSYPASAPYPDQFWYGTPALWTMLPTNGVWPQLVYGEKVFWWRDDYRGDQEPQPELTVMARRLDAQAPDAKSDTPATNAYSADFQWAMLSGVQVSTPGCWELTGRYANQSLSFVVWVAP